MFKKVIIKSKEDVLRLNEVACQQYFDISVSEGNSIVDAKSLLALFPFVGKRVHIVVEDNLDAKVFTNVVNKMRLEAV